MPDISMCRNHACDSSRQCYRYMAIPSPYMQSYMGFKGDGFQCDDFVKIDGRRIDETKGFNGLVKEQP